MSASPIPTDLVLYRHVGHVDDVFPDVDVDGDLTGLSWRDHAYVSTSVNSRGATYGQSLNLRILATEGTPGFSHGYLDSDEVVLGRGQKFTVIKDHGKDDFFVRQLDVVVDGG